MIKKVIPRWIIISCIIYIVILSVFSFSLRNSLVSGYDVGEEEHILWSSLQGRMYYNEIREVNHLGLHTYFFSIFLLPFYYLFTSTNFLLFLQASAFSLSSIPLYFLARRNLKGGFLVNSIVAAYLLYPTIWFVSLENFHPIFPGMPLLFIALNYMDKEEWNKFFFSSIVFMLVVEYFSFLVVGLGAYIFLRINRNAGVKTVMLGVIYFILTTSIIMPAFSEGSYFIYEQRYEHLGSSTFDIIKTMLTKPTVLVTNPSLGIKLDYAFSLLKPLLFIPIFDLLIIAALPIAFANTLTSGFQTCFLGHHNLILIPVIFGALIYGFRNLSKRFSSRIIRKLTYVFLLFVVFSFAQLVLLPILSEEISNSIDNPYCIVENQVKVWGYFQNKSYYHSIHDKFESIEVGESVRASESLLSFFNKREEIKHFEFYHECFEEKFLVVNMEDISKQKYKDALDLQRGLSQIGYELDFEDGKIQVFKQISEDAECQKLV